MDLVRRVSERQAANAAQMVAARHSKQSVARKAQPGDLVILGTANRTRGRAGGAAKVAMRKFTGPTQEATVLKVEKGGHLRVRILQAGSSCGDTLVVPPDVVLMVIDRTRVDFAGPLPGVGVGARSGRPLEGAGHGFVMGVAPGGGVILGSDLDRTSVAGSVHASPADAAAAGGGGGGGAAGTGIQRVGAAAAEAVRPVDRASPGGRQSGGKAARRRAGPRDGGCHSASMRSPAPKRRRSVSVAAPAAKRGRAASVSPSDSSRGGCSPSSAVGSGSDSVRGGSSVPSFLTSGSSPDDDPDDSDFE